MFQFMPWFVFCLTDSRRVFARRSLMAAFLACAASFVSAADQLGNEPTGTMAGHPAIAQSPRHATTSSGRQGDAINIAFVGSEEDLHRALAVAGWYAADAITLKPLCGLLRIVCLRSRMPMPRSAISTCGGVCKTQRSSSPLALVQTSGTMFASGGLVPWTTRAAPCGLARQRLTSELK